jgi:hypothetical protein
MLASSRKLACSLSDHFIGPRDHFYLSCLLLRRTLVPIGNPPLSFTQSLKMFQVSRASKFGIISWVSLVSTATNHRLFFSSPPFSFTSYGPYMSCFNSLPASYEGPHEFCVWLSTIWVLRYFKVQGRVATKPTNITTISDGNRSNRIISTSSTWMEGPLVIWAMHFSIIGVWSRTRTIYFL